MRRKYHINIYFCTKYKKYFKYSSSPTFRPQPEDIVRQLSHFSLHHTLIVFKDESYPLPVKKTPEHFVKEMN
jgi:hypothetical protein